MTRTARQDEVRRAFVLGTIKDNSLPGDQAGRARHCRRRAEELRIIAREVLLRETGRTLLSLADSYEQMAEMAEGGFSRNGIAANEL